MVPHCRIYNPIIMETNSLKQCASKALGPRMPLPDSFHWSSQLLTLCHPFSVFLGLQLCNTILCFCHNMPSSPTGQFSCDHIRLPVIRDLGLTLYQYDFIIFGLSIYIRSHFPRWRGLRCQCIFLGAYSSTLTLLSLFSYHFKFQVLHF